jgi:hypothetical protein
MALSWYLCFLRQESTNRKAGKTKPLKSFSTGNPINAQVWVDIFYHYKNTSFDGNMQNRHTQDEHVSQIPITLIHHGEAMISIFY